MFGITINIRSDLGNWNSREYNFMRKLYSHKNFIIMNSHKDENFGIIKVLMKNFMLRGKTNNEKLK